MPFSGARVRIAGLASRPDLNGKEGVCLNFVEEKSRWQVKLDGEADAVPVLVKLQNLELVSSSAVAFAVDVMKLTGDQMRITGLHPEEILASLRAKVAQELHVASASVELLLNSIGLTADGCEKTFAGAWAC